MKKQILFRTACTVALTLLSAGELFARTRYSSSSSSSSGTVFLASIGVVAVIGGITLYAYYADKKRAGKIQAIATRLGFTFRRKPTDADNALIVGCHIARTGHGHITSNVLEVAHSDELKMTLFDHAYTVGYGKSSSHYNQTITRMQSPMLNLPVFTLFPETFSSKIGKLFGGTDINFPEAPLFSKKYILRGPDEAAIRSVFSPDVMQFLVGLPWLVLIDADGDTLFVHRTSKRTKPEEIEAAVAEGKQILAKFFEAQNSGRPAIPPPMPPPIPV